MTQRRNELTTERVIGFFVAKGLLISEYYAPKGSERLNSKDVLWVAKHAEPRVLEVLPAAILHFPSSFPDKEKFPRIIHKIVEAIKAGETDGPEIKGFSYKDMKRWADMELSDQRTVPLSKKKVLKAFRLRPSIIELLQEKAEAKGLNATSYLEELIECAQTQS